MPCFKDLNKLDGRYSNVISIETKEHLKRTAVVHGSTSPISLKIVKLHSKQQTIAKLQL